MHESTLAYYSGFFRKALLGKFSEGKSKTVTLKDEETDIFELFVHWLYYQQLPSRDMGVYSAVVNILCNGHSKLADLEGVVKLYVLGDKYDVPGLRKDAIDLVFHTVSRGSLPHRDDIKYAFDHLLIPDPMCRLLVDLQWYYECPGGTERTEFDNAAFVQAIWQRYVYLNRSDDKSFDDVLQLCDYHDHATQEERETCEKRRKKSKPRK